MAGKWLDGDQEDLTKHEEGLVGLERRNGELISARWVDKGSRNDQHGAQRLLDG